MTPSIIGTLEQRPRGKGKHRFELFDDGRVLVRFKRGLEQHETSIELARLERHPQRHQERQGCAFTVFVVFALALVGALAGVVFTSWDSGGRLAFMVAFVPLAIIAWAGWREFVRNSYDILLFVDPITGRNLVLHQGLPDQARFEEFVAKLQKEVAKHSAVTGAGAPRGTADQIRELAKLKDEGILTEEEFKTGKQKILEGQPSGGPIGFAS